MERVQQWLEGLGLGQYSELFMQNAITFELLPDLDSDAEPECTGRTCPIPA